MAVEETDYIYTTIILIKYQNFWFVPEVVVGEPHDTIEKEIN